MQRRAPLFLHHRTAAHRPLVAISACLTGAAVRYDGGDRYQPGIDDWLGAQAELLPICPEFDAGLGVPRPPVRLVRIDGELRARGRDDTSLDVTDALRATARHHCTTLAALPLCGYLWKSRSPSCGHGSTPLFDAAGHQAGSGSGLQAHAIAEAMPWLVMAEEEMLQQAERVEHFLLCCRLVFDGLYAGPATARRIADHYRALLVDLTAGEGEALALAIARDDARAVVTVLIERARTLPAQALHQRLSGA